MTNKCPIRILELPSIDRMTGKNQSGFTMVELLVALALSLIVLGAVYSVYRVQAHTLKAQEYRMESQEYARAALEMMVREMRNSGYFPNRAVCITTPANIKGIVSAAALSIRFVYDADANNDCLGTGGSEEDITYSYDAAALNISRTVKTNNVDTTQVLTDGNVTAFQLAYYPQQTGASSPAPYCFAVGTNNPTGCAGGDVASNLANIQRVSVSLTVQSKSTDTQFGGQQTVTLNSNVNLRNRGLMY